VTIQKGQIFHAVIREDPQIDYAEVLACGPVERFVEARMDDFEYTTTGKHRKLVRVRLIVDEVVEEMDEKPVRA